MDTTVECSGEKERRFSINICTQPSHVQDSNHVNNLNETLYNIDSLDETIHNVNSFNETLLNESKLQKQNNRNTKGQLSDSLKVCNVNNSHIEQTVKK